MTQHSKLVDGLTNATISPATANLQREIREVLQELLDEGHYNYETQAITIGGDSLGKGVNLACKKVWLATGGSDVQVTVVDSADSTVVGDTQGFLLPTITTGSPLALAVDNVGRLRFYGSADAVVYILVRK